MSPPLNRTSCTAGLRLLRAEEFRQADPAPYSLTAPLMSSMASHRQLYNPVVRARDNPWARPPPSVCSRPAGMVEANHVTELMGDQSARVSTVLDPQLAPRDGRTHRADARWRRSPRSRGCHRTDHNLCLRPALDLPEFHFGTRAVPGLGGFFWNSSRRTSAESRSSGSWCQASADQGPGRPGMAWRSPQQAQVKGHGKTSKEHEHDTRGQWAPTSPEWFVRSAWMREWPSHERGRRPR